MEWRYIKPSKSPYGSPVLFVDQKDKRLHMCINYHALNKIIIKNNYPLLGIDYLFDRLNGVCYLIHIDMKSGCYQICMGKIDVEKIAMRTISLEEKHVFSTSLCD
jgi:hypothetical protein